MPTLVCALSYTLPCLCQLVHWDKPVWLMANTSALNLRKEHRVLARSGGTSCIFNGQQAWNALAPPVHHICAANVCGHTRAITEVHLMAWSRHRLGTSQAADGDAQCIRISAQNEKFLNLQNAVLCSWALELLAPACYQCTCTNSAVIKAGAKAFTKWSHGILQLCKSPSERCLRLSAL